MELAFWTSNCPLLRKILPPGLLVLPISGKALAITVKPSWVFLSQILLRNIGRALPEMTIPERFSEILLSTSLGEAVSLMAMPKPVLMHVLP